ncbi:MAG: hypothetical protein KF752_12175 [Pirellulaceae bacterium]|nr:hypothetical protein [Pirellulaceae bacterium]
MVRRYLEPTVGDRAVDLEALERKLADQNQAALKQLQERDQLDAELQMLHKQPAEIRAETAQQTDSHDYFEAETRHYLIDVDLGRAGWTLDQHRDREYKVTGMPKPQGIGYADYMLWGDVGKPLAVVEAKKATVDPQQGKPRTAIAPVDVLQRAGRVKRALFWKIGFP